MSDSSDVIMKSEAPVADSSSTATAKSSPPPNLPKDTALRAVVSTYLNEHADELHQGLITMKIVRAAMIDELGLPNTPEVHDALKVRLKSMVQEEINKITTQKANEGNESATKKKDEKKEKKEAKKEAKTEKKEAKKEAKSEKKKSESKSPGKRPKEQDEDGDEEPPKKKTKSSNGSSSTAASSTSTSSVDEAEIERLAAAAEDDDEAEGEGEVEPEPELSQDERDAALAAELSASYGRPRRAAAPPPKKPKALSKARKPKDPNAPVKKAAISQTLSDFFGKGETEMNRGEIVKQLWVYIKANSLQDPNNGRKILLDDKMRTVFGPRKSMDMLSMSKLIQPHIKNKHQLTDS